MRMAEIDLAKRFDLETILACRWEGESDFPSPQLGAHEDLMH